MISIHAPLAGSDYPFHDSFRNAFKFQSTLPSRGATSDSGIGHGIIIISIHAPLAGSDAGNHKLIVVQIISIHAPLAGSDLEARMVYL